MELLNDNETEGGDLDFHPNILQDIPEEVDWRGGMGFMHNEDQNHYIAADDLSYNQEMQDKEGSKVGRLQTRLAKNVGRRIKEALSGRGRGGKGSVSARAA